jgi:hypothetical protein
MQKCITCGAELHPERAKKYDYCMSPECQKKNLKGLTMVAVGVNKAAEQYLLLDERTEQELASGKYHDQRRGSFGTSGTAAPSSGGATTSTVPAASTAPAANAVSAASTAAAASSTATPQRARRQPVETARPAARKPVRHPWSEKQRRLALLYNEQGLRPEEIAQKLGLSTYLVTQIILTSRNRGKL